MTERTPLEPVPGLARSSKIVGPPPRRPSVQAVSKEPSPVVQTSPKPLAKKVPPANGLPSGAATTYKRVTLSLPLVVVESLRSRATLDQVPQVDVLMDALESTSSRLPELLEGEVSAQPVGLFIRSAPRPSEPMTTLSLRILTDNLNVIDALVNELDAPSRSRLCDIALRDYLALT